MRKIAAIIFFIFITLLTIKFFYGHKLSIKTNGISGLLAEKKIDYLFIGSSQTRQSLNPKTLVDSLSNPYILAYNGNSLYYSYFLLKILIENDNLQTKKIIVEAYPFRIYQKTSFSDPRMFNSLRAKEKIAFLHYSNNILSALDIYELLVMSGNESMLTYPLLNHFHTSLSYKGGYINKQVPGLTPKEFLDLKSPLNRKTNRDKNNLQLTALSNIIALCKKHNISLCFLEPPVSAHIASSAIFKHSHLETKKFVKKNNIQYLDNDNYHFKNNNPLMFNDAVHLSTLGRDIYTRSIIGLIK